MTLRNITGAVLLSVCFILCAMAAVVGIVFWRESSPAVVIGALFICAALTVAFMLVNANSDFITAEQTNNTLGLASQTLPFMSQGLGLEPAQAVCDLLLPSTAAASVAITDRERVLGFSGTDRDLHEPGTPILFASTAATIEDGETRVVSDLVAEGVIDQDSDDGEDASARIGVLKSGVIAPLIADGGIVGTLKFYYKTEGRPTETQRAMCEGFAQLLSTQLSLSYMQQKTELAAKMELKALQAQINPHFLFNTINTIASTVRTDPTKARVMLREFAVYYRRLLENSEDLIELAAEVEQTERYLMFQRARFGEDSIIMHTDIEEGLEDLRVPSFILQPMVENCVGHGRREEGPLTIEVQAKSESESVIITISDDGVGIPADKLDTIMDGNSERGMGIALRNVDARLKACFGSVSGLYIKSEEGSGTQVYLSLYNALADGA